jgi:hypothetical protein
VSPEENARHILGKKETRALGFEESDVFIKKLTSLVPYPTSSTGLAPALARGTANDSVTLWYLMCVNIGNASCIQPRMWKVLFVGVPDGPVEFVGPINSEPGLLKPKVETTCA